jgi:membrane protease YdiL (CAAX protease family)
MIVNRVGTRAVERDSSVVRSIHRPYLNRPLLTAVWLYVGLAVIRIAGALQEVLLVGALVVTPAALAAVPRQQWGKVGVRWPRSWRSLLLGVAVTVAAYAVAVGSVTLLVGTGEENWASGILGFFELGLAPGTAAGAALDIAALVLALGVAVPLAEEVFYRGILHTELQSRFGTWVAILATSAGWSLVHLGDYGLDPFNASVVATVLPSVLIMGIALGWTRVWTNSAIGSAVAQGVANLLLAAWVSQWG